MTGAELFGDHQCRFSVWAPEKKKMTLHLVYPEDKEIKMKKDDLGYFSATVGNMSAGNKYFFKPDEDQDFPDPASNYQPDGVHGPSEIIDHGHFIWSDQEWRGIPLKKLILYEIHTGTFTQEGTFEAVIPHLDHLTDTGINALELMPVNQFPGNRNWGYDGVFPYSVQNSYGGPEGLKKLVNACHNQGIAVFLDVVYNHLGPEGNYLGKFGPYFTQKYQVPWGAAINMDDTWCDGVREYFSENPCFWFENYHLDGLRADAIHMIYDQGAIHFWELTQKKLENTEQRLGRKFYMIAESDLNSPRVVKSPETGGYGFDAQWLDDFHHALYVILDKKGKSRYEDFGKMEQLAKAYTDGFVHSGEFVNFRKRKHGISSVGIPGEKFVAFNQNHDQIGNRVLGERLSQLVSFERLKLAAAALFLSPYIPLLFMGEEYGEDNPFFYFVSHSDKALIKAVREGRKKEFEGYKWHTDPPDPMAIETFERSKIDLTKKTLEENKILLEWNKKLISFRREYVALQNTAKNDLRVYLPGQECLIVHRRSEDDNQHILCFFNFSEMESSVEVPPVNDKLKKILDSDDDMWKAKKSKEEKKSTLSEINARQKITIKPCSIVVYINK